MVRLSHRVEQVLAKNEEMSLRLRKIDDAMARPSQSTKSKDDYDDASVSSVQPVTHPEPPSVDVPPTAQDMQF